MSRVGRAIAWVVWLQLAGPYACGRGPCEPAAPMCDGETAVACVAGVERRTDCEPGGYCNRGECTPLGISLPADAGPHLDQTEWWYYTGHLAAGQASFGFQVTIFQYDLGGYFGYMCHVAVLDEAAGEHFHTEGITLTPATWRPADLAVLGCRIQLDGAGGDHILGVIEDGHETGDHPGTWRIELDLTPQKRVVPHGSDGIIPMGTAGGTSWYYSYTRLAAAGTLTLPQTGSLPVTGQAWMDHQWGDFDITEFQGWDWWSMQSTDGSEIMLFTFRDWDGVLVSQAGTLVEPDGSLTALEGLDAFSIEPQRSWASPHTDGIYPLDWDIRIPEQDWDLRVRTPIDDQEMFNIAQSYWEGVTRIEGARQGIAVRGVGFTELTGYATDWLDP